ncbi:hypothetical protein ITQ90_03305 [Pediococcus pentosaceus]|uniref:DUF308 domain-containing protein n=1 Tax=Pediococcus pentosaceus TaxID=1255 RepID=A0AB73HGV4_PEDPE|nr:hypothetical protein [Pediococcus pentosaceus]MBF7114531.1 hypothetical protein [Pediococcus pentosaceus]MDN3206775.1 hypothetical protein [Pediococcus pentosaceus]
MLYVLVLASITLLLGFFQFYSSIRNRGSIFLSSLLVIIPLAVVIFSARNVMETSHKSSGSKTNSTLIASKKSSLKDDKLEMIKSESVASSSKAQQVQQVQASLTKSFKSFGTVTYDPSAKTFSVSATDKDTKKVFNQLIENPDQKSNSNFKDIQDKFVEVSKSLKKELGKGYAVQLNQPDKNKAMIIAKDGKIVYSIFS